MTLPWWGIKGEPEGHCGLLGRFLEMWRMCQSSEDKRLIRVCHSVVRMRLPQNSQSEPNCLDLLPVSQAAHSPSTSFSSPPASLDPSLPSTLTLHFFSPSVFSQHVLHSAAKTAGGNWGGLWDRRGKPVDRIIGLWISAEAGAFLCVHA